MIDQLAHTPFDASTDTFRYFLAERDWKPIVEDYGPMPMTGLWGTPRTHEDSGMQEEHSLVCDLDTVGTAILKVCSSFNLRRTMVH
jgi:hypothetical protein